MFKNLYQLTKNKVGVQGRNFITQNTKRFSSYKQYKPPSGGGGYGSYALAGAGAAGITYLMMYGRTLGYSRTQTGIVTPQMAQ